MINHNAGHPDYDGDDGDLDGNEVGPSWKQ